MKRYAYEAWFKRTQGAWTLDRIHGVVKATNITDAMAKVDLDIEHRTRHVANVMPPITRVVVQETNEL